MLTFEKALFSDIKIIQTLANKIWYACYKDILSTQQIEYMLNLMYSEKTIQDEMEGEGLWELIWFDRQAIGFISVVPQNKTLKLNKLYISDAYHGKGFGKQSLAHVVKYASNNGFEYVRLNVNKQNVKAIKAYEKTGFVWSHSEVNDIGGGYVMDDHIYVYAISKE